MADGPHGLLTSAKLRMPSRLAGSETAGDKLRSREKQPRSPAKAPKRVLSGKRMWSRVDNQEVGKA